MCGLTAHLWDIADVMCRPNDDNKRRPRHATLTKWIHATAMAIRSIVSLGLNKICICDLIIMLRRIKGVLRSQVDLPVDPSLRPNRNPSAIQAKTAQTY